MTCSFCQKTFTPNYNPNTKRETAFCSRSCLARFNLEKFKLARIRIPQLHDPDWLFKQYWVEMKGTEEIGRLLGCTGGMVRKSMIQYGISRRTVGQTLLGKEKSIEHRINISDAAKGRWRGENNPNWQGGFGRRTIQIRMDRDYEIWRDSIKRKYNSHCAKCGKELGKECSHCGQIIQQYIHHIKSVKDYPKLVVDPDNGILYCQKCHRNEHN